jgi:hypothetical protein
MSGFDLPVISPDAKPEFRDAGGCAAWLQNLPLINVAPAHATLLGQLKELNRSEIPAAERLKILELLREAVLFVQTEQAKKFSGRQVPLSAQEREVFNNVVALWDALSQGHQRCLQAAGGGAQAALGCQRALWCVSQRIGEHYKVYQEIAAEDWNLLHRLYALAEERDVARDAIQHPVYKGKAEADCAETYAHALLLQVANPNEHAPRQTALISRWLERWSRKTVISRGAPPDQKAPLRVDLAGTAGAARNGATGDSVRYLDVAEIGKSVKKRVALLRKGESPATLGLGDDVPPAAAEQLLIMLFKQWCEDKRPRAHPRRSASGTAEICSGMAAMHYYVSGRPFRQPAEITDRSQLQHEEIATFGRVVTRQDDQYGKTQGFALETWQLKDQSRAGLRLERAEGAAAGRYQLHQLVAARPADGKSFILGMIRWLSVAPDLVLQVGVRTLPGMPQGAAVRGTGLNAATEKYVPALLLPAVEALRSPESLILPSGWYRPKRLIELYRSGAANVALTALLEHGTDYERVTFEPA